MDIAHRLSELRETVAEVAARAGHDPAVTIVAVTKTVPVDRVREAYFAGQRVFAENRVYEGAAKVAQLSAEAGDVEWHLIGHLQTNKVKAALQAFSLIGSVDSLRIAEKLNHQAGLQTRMLPVLLEINVGGEASKSGFSLEEFWESIPRLAQLPYLEIRGLMTMAPLAGDAEQARPIFRRLRELRDEVQEKVSLAATTELSMGMSGDYVVAIEEGATMVRIGQAIFGRRPQGKR